MRARCNDPNNPSYPYYGGRGIKVDPCWDDDAFFPVFLNYMGKKTSDDLSIDRPDNNKNYGPGNARWATSAEQELNKRNTAWVEDPFDGERLCKTHVALKYKINRTTLNGRLKCGLSLKEALTKPLGKHVRKK